jgi:hypothetical protein
LEQNIEEYILEDLADDYYSPSKNWDKKYELEAELADQEYESRVGE